jgi:capsular polysaccharide biosynthesis protein
MLRVAEESKKEIPELIPVHPPRKIFRKKEAIPLSCPSHSAFDIPVSLQTPTFLARVPRGRILGPTVAVLTQNDRMLSDVSLDWGHPGLDHFAYRRFILPRCRDFDGSALVLACTGADTYFHWFTDALPRLEIASRAMGANWKPDWWVVNTLDRPFIRESLTHLGIPLNRVISLKILPHIRFSNLWIPSLPCESSSGDTPDWVVKYLKSSFKVCIDSGTETALPKKIWIDRSLINSRRLELSKRDKTILRGYGFSIVCLEDLPLLKQINIFHGAELVTGPHGAGFSNIVFSSKPKILEFFLPQHVNACYYSLSQHVGADYSYHIPTSSHHKTFQSIRDPLRIYLESVNS